MNNTFEQWNGDEKPLAEYSMQVCALRFSCYEWAKQQVGQEGASHHLAGLRDRIAQTFQFFQNAEENFAVFAFMQRNAHHWGDGFLDHPNVNWCRAAAFLFLELRNQEPPAEFAIVKSCEKWNSLRDKYGEQAAATIRRWLLAAERAQAPRKESDFVQGQP